MSISRISARYAKPLLELAEDKGVLEQVNHDMANFKSLCESNRDFVLMLRSPIISHLKKAAILQRIFKKEFNSLTSQFLDIVTKKQREKYLPDIAKEFTKLYNVKMGNQEATVTTTFKLDDKIRKMFEKLVMDISGKKPILSEQIDAELLGGYILQLGDQQIDESISGQLSDLKLKFKNETIN